MMKKRQEILYIFASTFILVAIWLGFNIYHGIATSTINEDTQIQIQPIDPNFDIATLEKLKTRKKIKPLTGNDSILPTGSITPPVTESVTGQIFPSPTATASQSARTLTGPRQMAPSPT